jgi:cytochrome P450
MIASSSTAQHVLNNTAIYVKPEADVGILEDMIGNGLITAEGEMHKRQRKVLNPAFAPGYIRDIVSIFSEKASDLVNVVSGQLKSQTTKGIDMYHLLKFSTLDIIGSAGSSLVLAYEGFGYEFNSLHNPDNSFAKAYETIMQRADISNIFNVATFFFPILSKLPFPNVLRLSAARRSTIKQGIQIVRDKEAESNSGRDILSLILVENRKAAVEGKLAEIELVDQCLTFLLAGHETTSVAVIPYRFFLC